MRILIHGINYAPELTGIGKYTGEMAEWLAKRGHDVHVLTALPYYPEWSVHKDYSGKRWHTELLNGVQVHRVPLYVPKDVSSLKRILHEFSFLLSTIPYWIKFLFSKKFDVVFCIAPPFHLAAFPWLYKKLKKSFWINHIQDLQVDAAKDLQMIKNQSLLKFMFNLERFFLVQGDKVSTISSGMEQKIINKGIDKSRMLYFPNWVDSEVIFPLPQSQSLRAEMGFSDDDKIILYSGNLGEKQGLDAVINIARKFISDSKIQFVISGSGGGKEKLVQLANKYELTNVHFFPLQPYEKLSALLAMADLHLVLQKSSAADLVMPSKLTGILAAGGCAIVTASPGTTLYDTVNQFKMGILVEPDNEAELEIGIRNGLLADIEIYKHNAREYAKKYLEKDNILLKFQSDVESLI